MVKEALVLGGGLAGGAAAILLARAGVPVHLLERQAEPHHKVCGEFISREALLDLALLGIDTARLGAVPIDRLRLVKGARQVEARLPFAAQGLSRKCLDEALLDVAADHGARIERGIRVTRLNGCEVSTDRGTRSAATILLATGKHDVRGSQRPTAQGGNGYVGFKMHWRPGSTERAAIENAIELILFDGGYAGMQLVARDVLNLCLVVQKRKLAELGGTWQHLLQRLLQEPGIEQRLGTAEPIFTQPLTIANLPYGHVHHPDTGMCDNTFRLGDQAAMTASLTGDGMAGALRSAFLAIECHQAGQSAKIYHRRVGQTIGKQVRRAMRLQRTIERPLAMHSGFTLLRLWPGLLTRLAEATRLPETKDD